MRDFIKKSENKAEENKEAPENPIDVTIMAKQYAKDEVRRERKHLKAYIAGRTQYKYLKKTYQVFTEDNIVREYQDQKEEE